MAVTFDDLPVAGPVPRSERPEVSHRLVSAISEAGIPAIGFVNEGQLYREGRLDTAEVDLLRSWALAGLDLGNHTATHLSLNRTPLADFEKNVLDGERVTRPLLSSMGKTIRYFRHPFLHTGRSVAIRDSLVTFLHTRGYRVAPVTVDNAEWIFALAYERSVDSGDTASASRVGAAYPAYMEAKIAYWERQSVRLFGREIPQVLLLHANRLNADRLPDLLAMLRRRGYRFCTLDQALSDPVFQTPDSYTGPAGISWLHRWALTRGRGALLPDEPLAPAWILEMAGVDSE